MLLFNGNISSNISSNNLTNYNRISDSSSVLIYARDIGLSVRGHGVFINNNDVEV